MSPHEKGPDVIGVRPKRQLNCSVSLEATDNATVFSACSSLAGHAAPNFSTNSYPRYSAVMLELRKLGALSRDARPT